MADTKVGGLYYEVDIELEKALEKSDQLRRELKSLGDNAKNSAGGIKTLETQAKNTATAVNQATKAGGAFRSQFQQAGYQIQDFIVQVQGGQSALVAFSQQGSQLAGAFGPGGAVVGAVIALGTVIAGTLITALNGGKNAMDALREAADSMDKVITVSQNGVAALSDKYASQYMIPGDNGSVISNRDLSGVGGGGQVIHQTIQVNGNPDDRTLLLIQQAAQQGAKQGYQMVVGDLAGGTGKASKALKSSFNTRNKLK